MNVYLRSSQIVHKGFTSLIRLGKKGRNLLVYIWLLRLLGLFSITYYYYQEKDRFPVSELAQIRVFLLLFFGYIILIGFLGVIREKWFWSSHTKIIQALFEIALYSVFYSITHDFRSEIYFLYFLPVFYVLTLSENRGYSFFVVFLSILGLGGSFALIAIQKETSFPFDLFLVRSLFLVTMSMIVFSRKREPLVVDIQEQELQIKSLLDSLDTTFLVLDKQNRVQFVNPSLEERFGPLNPGQSLWSYFSPAQGAPVMKFLGEESAVLTTTLIALNGEQVKVEMRFSPMLGEMGESIGAIVHLTDQQKSRAVVEGLREQLKISQAREVELLGEMKKWLATYHDLSGKLLSSQQPDAVMQLLVDEIKSRSNSDVCALYLCENGQIARKALSGKKLDDSGASDQPTEAWLIRQVILGDNLLDDGKPLVFNSPELLPSGAIGSLGIYNKSLTEQRLQHTLILPIRGQKDLSGAFLLLNKLSLAGGDIDYHGYKPSDLDFLSTQVSMATIAIQNTLLLNQTRRLILQEHERARQANAILEISRLINQDLNLGKIFETIIASLGDLIQFDSVSIQMIEGDVLKIKACNGFDDNLEVQNLEFPVDNPDYPNFFVIQDMRPFIVVDVHQSFPHFDREREKYHSAYIRSWMGIPIIISEKVVGMICCDHSQPGFFNKAMGELASAFANHIAIAVANARLFAEKEINESNLKNIYQIAAELSSSLDYDQVVNKIIDFAHQKVHSSHTGIVLLDENNHPYDSVETPLFAKPLHLRARPGIGVTHRVIQNGQPVFYQQVEPGPEHNPAIIEEGFKSYAGVPVKAGGKIHAVLFVHSKQDDELEKYQSLLLPLGLHAGVALENARLYENARRQVEMLDSLVTISRELIHQKGLDALLAYCAVEGARIFNVEDCSLSLINEQRSTIDLRASSCIPKQVWNTRDSYLDKPGLTAFVARTGKTLNLAGDEYKEHPAWAGKYEAPFLDHLEYLPSKGVCHTLLLSALLDSQGRNQGVIKLENRIGKDAGRSFSKFEVALLETFASLIGWAVESARQSEQTSQNIRRETRKALASDLHYIQNLLHGAVVLRLGSAQEELSRNHLALLQDELSLIHKAASFVHSHLFNTQNDLAEDHTLEDIGLVGMLRLWAEFLHVKYGKIEARGRRKLPVKIEYVLYKIGLEALNNVYKHAGCDSMVDITLEIHDNTYAFSISDNGEGYDMAEIEVRPARFGLVSIQEWCKEIDALVKFHSSLGSGTRIVVTGSLS
jgi:GAF domain-containing protein